MVLREPIASEKSSSRLSLNIHSYREEYRAYLKKISMSSMSGSLLISVEILLRFFCGARWLVVITLILLYNYFLYCRKNRAKFMRMFEGTSTIYVNVFVGIEINLILVA